MPVIFTDFISHVNPLMMGMAALIAFQVHTIVRGHTPFDADGRSLGQKEALEGAPTDMSWSVFTKHRSSALLLGPTVGVIAVLAGMWQSSSTRSYLLSAWFMVAFQAAAVFAEKLPQKRLTLVLTGAVLSLILSLMTVFAENGPPKDATGRVVQAASFIAAVVSLGGFLAFPRQPDKFLGGRLIDRQFSSSILELATFSWSMATFEASNVAQLDVKGLPILPPTRTRKLTGRHIENASFGPAGLKAALAKEYWDALASQWILTILKSLAGLVPRLVVFRLLAHLSTKPRISDIELLWLAVALGFSKAVELWIDSWLQWITASKLQIPIQATLSSMVYRKALRLPNVAIGTTKSSAKTSEMSVITHMRSDSARACTAYTDTNRIAMMVVQLASTTIMLSNLIGWKSLLLGLLASAFFMPLTTIFSKKYIQVQSALTRSHDQRSSLLTKALLAFRQLKLSATEHAWEAKMMDCRKRELDQQFRSAIWMSGLVVAANINPMVLSGVALYHSTLQGKPLSAAVAFTCIDLFDNLHSDISILPLITTRIRGAWTSIERLQAYLSQPEVTKPETVLSKSVAFCRATICWPGAGGANKGIPFAVRDLSVRFPAGELSLILGGTGSGKSLVLSALAGEANVVSGTIESPRRSSNMDLDIGGNWILPHQLALVSQSPWIDNATIRENILFGLPFNQHRYQSALYSCALNQDVGMLKCGDMTVVGPKGVALSGGQRWRVALARALYSRASIILMDDILSAVDARVREWLVAEALNGPLATGRTRVLATHHAAQCEPRAACIVRLCDGTVEETLYLPSTSVSTNDKVEKDSVVDRVGMKVADINTPEPQLAPSAKDSKSSVPRDKPRLGAAYMMYFRATGGTRSWMLVAVTAALQQFLNFIRSWWLKEWTVYQDSSSRGTLNANESRVAYFGVIYIFIGFLGSFGVAASGFVWWWLGRIASEDLFEKMTRALFGSPLWWVERTSHGEIISRFTSDMGLVDNRLPHDLGYMITCICQVASILLTSFSVSSYGSFISAAIVYAYFTIGARLVSVTLKFKHLGSIATSSLYQHLSSLQTSDALLTIRAYGVSTNFRNRMFEHINDTSSAAWHHALCRIMMEFQLNMLGALFLTAVAVSAILTGADAGTTGIALSFAMDFAKTISTVLQKQVIVESGLNSAERVAEYGRNIPADPASGVDPPDMWPSAAQIDVRNLVMGYHKELPPALNGITFLVSPGERVGVVGRTGAGKSSLTLALTGLMQHRHGEILVDGVNIFTLKPRALRERFFIISQDPYITAGSIRSILDPDALQEDHVLETALARVRFPPCDATTRKMDLSFHVEEGGTNISQGQRQLLSLARAILSNRNLIIMDEATSAVDAETDAAIQAALRAGLPRSTMIVVAHRLATIAGFDKVMVLEDGALVEFGRSADLYRQKGPFWKLVNSSPDREQLLRAMESECL